MSLRFVRPLAAVALALTFGACGSDKSPAGPSPTPTPTPIPVPTPVLNGSPRISSMTTFPSFGVATLTSFAMTAAATDPDGDTLTYDWDLGDGSRASGPSLGKTYLAAGPTTITLTVTDGRGGSATESRTITVGTLNGTWTGTVNFGGNDNRASTMTLSQVPGVGGIVTGTLTMAPGFKGLTDPAQFGRIDLSGAFEIRWKVDPFLDFTMRGQMDATGNRISGGTFGSGFGGEPFVFDKR
jgi:PKD domain-containing protein